MKVLKNLFGNHTKIHASTIWAGNNKNSRQIDKISDAPGDQTLSSWLKDCAERNDFLTFTINQQGGGLPSSNFNYGAGFAIKRFNSILFILIFATDGKIATRTFNYSSDTWTNWRII